ncbi:5'/3'-nucleotidase SurE [Pirellulaceae bacterium]|nr:5'/3'-nucleotidase SurE [Pirellulaceae bacterium]
MNILITNDDGIDAPGLAAMESLASRYGTPYTFAPKTEQSGVGHRVTISQQLDVIQESEFRYSVDGTPADCVRIAIHAFALKFGMVLSGINAGGNLGVDVFMSGTTAAAREASYHGIPSFAVSQYHALGSKPDWEKSIELAKRGVDFAKEKVVQEKGFWNINLPSIPDASEKAVGVPVRICRVDRNPHAIGYERNDHGFTYVGNYQQRPGDPSSDVDLCFGGVLTISYIQ